MQLFPAYQRFQGPHGKGEKQKQIGMYQTKRYRIRAPKEKTNSKVQICEFGDKFE